MTSKTSVRDNIVAAALELAHSVGLQSVTQAQVATEAGIRQSHLTYYFPTRIDLIKATLEKLVEKRIEENNLSLQEGDKDHLPRISTLRKFFTSKVRDTASTRLIVSVMLVSQEDNELKQWFARFDSETTLHLTHLFRNNGLAVSEPQVELFHATLIGAAIRALHLCTDEALDQASKLAGIAFDRLVDEAEEINIQMLV